MAYKYVEYGYPYPHLFHKELLWIDKNCNCYFAFKLNDTDNWTYYAGNGSHALNTGSLLTSYAVEADAITNYLTTVRDITGKVLALLPLNFQAKYARVYIESGNSVNIWEWIPSVYFVANEIVSGTLEITDQLTDNPMIKVIASGNDRLLIGELDTNIYGIQGKDSTGNVVFELRSDDDAPFLATYADSQAIELELMKMNFQAISWAQFAIYDAFDDETKRASPDPSTFDARVFKSHIDNGDDATADRSFGFVSKTYTAITTIESGTSTSAGLNFLTDTGKSWFTNQCKNLTLVDSDATTFTVTSNTSNTLTVVGTPTAGAYSLVDDDPTSAVAFASYLDSTNGGTGYVKLEVSFNDGTNYQTFLDTETAIDLLQGTVAIANPGHDYIARITLKNDASGNGAVLYKFLICTDPSPWRY